MALTLSHIPVVMVSCIFSYQTPASEPQDFVNLLHPISDLELHSCKNQTRKCFLFLQWQFWMMFNDLLLLFCIAKSWGPFPALGVQNSSHTTFSLLQSRGEGKQLSFCHTAIKQKAQLVFESTFPTYTGFPSNWLLCLFHTLHFTWILFSNLVLLSPGPGVSWPVRMQSDWKLCILSQGKHPDFLF